LFFYDEVRRALPLRNVWIGVSVEDQQTANERIPLLLQVPAAVHFLSCEPLLGTIDVFKYTNFNRNTERFTKIEWVIAGGESGHNARPMHPDWVRSIRDQCKSANIPFFFKQWGEWIDNQNMPREHITNKILQTHIFGSGNAATVVEKLGKSKTGNTLDGVQHLNYPCDLT